MLVAVVPLVVVGVIVSVLPLSVGGVIAVVPQPPDQALRARWRQCPTERSSGPALYRCCSTSAPAVTVDTFVPVAPVMPSIALRTVCTVAVLPVPTPIVTLPLASVAVAAVADVLKVMVLPSTVRVEPSAIAVERLSLLVPPTNNVEAVIVAGVVSLLFTAVPETVLLDPGPNKFSAVAPEMAVDENEDFAE